MTDEETFFATLRMYELEGDRPKVAVLPESEDVDALVERLFDAATA
jgi:hypothetical protein